MAVSHNGLLEPRAWCERHGNSHVRLSLHIVNYPPRISIQYSEAFRLLQLILKDLDYSNAQGCRNFLILRTLRYAKGRNLAARSRRSIVYMVWTCWQLVLVHARNAQVSRASLR
jgi:hypothetical protein